MITINRQIKPFLKWAGGKSQLIGQISTFLPPALKTGKIKKYFEPFLGGGAIYFWLADHYDFEYAYLYELNPSVAICYKVIQTNVKKLVKELNSLEKEYLYGSDKAREKLFYDKREEFNGFLRRRSANSHLRRAALLIFLNKTCFNGLYRVNSKGEFNVPFGRYNNPAICNEDNLLAVHDLLQNAEVSCGDFEQCLEHADNNSFVYFDPPYRPISATASFTSYSKDSFGDNEQKRLCRVFGELDHRGVSVMLSNSDPKNVNPTDEFFDDLYNGYHIERLNATRLINCNAERRGFITEILVMNY
ncbi:MAG: DNA adenine methylase [Candidatus Omnitrophica bacterium]|nr:DNA adenine methylase [Candidatus Omnitrophota bacterium]MBU4479746.1 DNA adenine methylase [Candidatus Omnitrophota bacterium]